MKAIGAVANMKPTFFRTPDEFRKWLAKHHDTTSQLQVGYYKKDTGKPSITWPESVDEALCFGWIDGIRKSIDDSRYTIRFTPRRSGSVWSSVNIGRVQELIKQGRMQPAGLAAYEVRRENKSGIYSYEQRSAELVEPYNRLLKKYKAAWSFFQQQSTTYRKAVSWWIVSAKKEETRLKRLERLAAFSSKGQKLPEMRVGKKPL